MSMDIGIAGISGRIGQRLITLVNKKNRMNIVCGLVSINSDFTHPDITIDSECQKADIWIDFSTPDAFDKVLSHCKKSLTPLVSGTTGLTHDHFRKLDKAGKHIPVLWASNFSISINLIQQMLSAYTRLNPVRADIVETHHINKADKPSGTAITLARSIKPNATLKSVSENEFVLDDIKITSKRQSDIAGIHCVNLYNGSENITIKHEAKSPEVFAQGAIDVAEWLRKQKKGIYTMDDYIDSLS